VSQAELQAAATACNTGQELQLAKDCKKPLANGHTSILVQYNIVEIGVGQCTSSVDLPIETVEIVPLYV
jgi:hypothetical protein